MATYADVDPASMGFKNSFFNVLDTLIIKNYAGPILTFIMFFFAGLSFWLSSFSTGQTFALLACLCGWALVFASAVLSAGVAYHFFRLKHAARRYPPPGQMIDVGGFRMHVLAEGENRNTPTIVWVPGGHGQGLFMYHFHREAAKQTRSIIFDRAGSGWSDPGPLPRHTPREIDEFVTLMKNAGENGPFVMVGHSFGGLFSVNLAQRYPEMVQAVVLLDPSTPRFLAYLGDTIVLPWLKTARFAALKANFGLGWHKKESQQETSWYDCLAPMNHARLALEFSPSAMLLDPLAVLNTADRAIGLAQQPECLGDIPLLTILANPDPEDNKKDLGKLWDDMGLSSIERKNAMIFLDAEAIHLKALSRVSELLFAPENSNHLFPYEHQEFVMKQIRKFIKI